MTVVPVLTPRPSLGRVIVADDMSQYRDLVRQQIEEGFRADVTCVATVDQLEAVLSTAGADAPRIAILDRRLSNDQRKIDKLEQIARELSQRRVVVVLLTAYPPDEAAAQRLPGVFTVKKGARWPEELRNYLEQHVLPGESAAGATAPTAAAPVEERLYARVKRLFVNFLTALPPTEGGALLWAGRELTIDEMVDEVERDTPLGKDLVDSFVATFEADLQSDRESDTDDADDEGL